MIKEVKIIGFIFKSERNQDLTAMFYLNLEQLWKKTIFRKVNFLMGQKNKF